MTKRLESPFSEFEYFVQCSRQLAVVMTVTLFVPLLLVTTVLWSSAVVAVTTTPNSTVDKLQTEESSKRSTYSYSNELEEVLKSNWKFPPEETALVIDPENLESPPEEHAELSEETPPNGKVFDEEVYECVLLPKQTSGNYVPNSEYDELMANHQVHHLYSNEIDDQPPSPLAEHHRKPKLRDFGNFLYVDDSSRPSTSYSMLAHDESSKASRRKPVHQASTSSHHQHHNSKAKKSHKEMDELFAKLKDSLDQLMCYQNDECYGGSLGGENIKLDQFIRHIRMSKKVFDLLEKNRNQLLKEQQLQQQAQAESEDSEFQDRRYMNFGAPVRVSSLVYSDSNSQPVAIRSKRPPLPIQYYDTTTRTRHPNSASEEFSSRKRRRRQPAVRVASSTGSFIDQLSRTKLASKLGKNLISSLLGGGSGTMNRDSVTPGVISRLPPSHHHHRPAAAVPTANTFTSASSIARLDWPKPVLVIKEYEEYAE